MATRAVAYIRVSTDKQADDGFSLDAQRARVRAYCELYDVELVEIIEETASAKTLDRPELRRALRTLREGRADALLIVKLDRLTRSVADLGSLLTEYFQRYELLSVFEHIDTRTAAGRLILNVLGSVSQWEREVISERTKEAMAELRAQGVKFGAPSMHDRIPETVQKVRDLYATGEFSHKGLAAYLNELGIRSAKGGRWWPKTVRSALVS